MRFTSDYGVFLVDDVTGSCYLRYQSDDRFDCEVEMGHRQYDAPRGCHYEIVEND